MNALTHKLSVLVGGPGFDEVRANQRRFSTVVAASLQVITLEFYRIGRDEFRRRHFYNKRYAILAALTIMHFGLFAATSGVFISGLVKFSLPRLEHFYVPFIFSASWVLLIVAEFKVLNFLEQKYPRGASGSLARSPELAPAPLEGIMTNASERPNIAASTAPEAGAQDFMSWLESQPKARELAALAERTFKGPDDLQAMAAQRRAHYDKVWNASHSKSEDVQPLTR
ncbi:hypothetical protein [Methylobacterium brachiatum]|uniref:hypothetical protein n=1 Tax=Methylobacterium brachiatum TaxID=269660 RepID=UPI0024474B4C|nr:hypothetical protein [Methylobacterium brachiatum]MDH2313893.1 hypothetical protein [Methylobacterium brachiatum]